MNLGYSALYTITYESFPTEIRNIGNGFVSISGRIAGVCCPIATGVILQQKNGFELAVFLYGLLFLICGGIGFLLKETRIDKNKLLIYE